jgi:hypothetical protein
VFDRLLDLFNRRSKSTKGKKADKASNAARRAAASGTATGYPEGWAPLYCAEIQETSWKSEADQPYIQDMYMRSMDEVDYDWDGVEDRLLEDPPAEL